MCSDCIAGVSVHAVSRRITWNFGLQAQSECDMVYNATMLVSLFYALSGQSVATFMSTFMLNLFVGDTC